MNIFDDLKASLEEAVDIRNGDKAPGNVTRFEIADVRAIREQLNVSQSEMARALGTSVDTIKSWESKRRNPTVWRLKCWPLFMPIPHFFGNWPRSN